MDKEDIIKHAKAIKDFCVEYTYKESECPFYRGRIEVAPNCYIIKCELNKGNCSPCNWEMK